MGKSQSKLDSRDLKDLLDCTYFSRREIETWYRDFLNDCPTGFLTKEEFESIYQQFFPQGDSKQFATFIFNTFDRDKDGTINFREFMCALSVTSRGSLEEKLNWAFSLYDLDDDGFITRHEMVCIVTAIYQMIGGLADLPDDESTPQKRVEKIFSQMDTDRDGRLCKDEFIEGSRMDPWIVQALTTGSGFTSS